MGKAKHQTGERPQYHPGNENDRQGSAEDRIIETGRLTLQLNNPSYK